jgi:hypothetical protein
MHGRLIVLAVAVLWMMVVGCSSTPVHDEPRPVFARDGSFSQSGPATTVDVIDIGVPLLHNLTGHSVRLQWVRLARHSKVVQVVHVTAYSYSQVGQGISAAFGDLIKYCRKEMTPYPVTDVVTAPDTDSNWFVILALSIRKPGVYHIARVKIGYMTDGQVGWQYQDLETTLTVRQAARRTKPRFDGCPVFRD